ncbi:MAG TPA: 7-cyano-7-deazaguanine synthase QueC [Planctomycetota bacterium]|nr:7-cyano-7-deazaguanine synthase QueC [Planctomycetota bacterium]
MEKALVLLSGGLDSTVAAVLARDVTRPVLALTVDYGQKAAKRELAASYALSRRLGLEHRVVYLPFLREAAQGALVDRAADVPRPAAADLDDREASARSAAAVWVPARNFAFIAMAATWAEAGGAKHVVVGFNREEAATFPDNSAEFLEATNRALAYATRNAVQVISPTAGMDKREIVAAGRAADAPLEWCWSCYLGGDQPCGTCESCRRFDRAVAAAGVGEWLEERRRRRDSS